MCSPITLEWAKQLVFSRFGGSLDFANMKMIQVPEDMDRWHVHIFPAPEGGYRNDLPPVQYEIEEIYLIRWHDPYNREVTHIGYGMESNRIILGETIQL